MRNHRLLLTGLLSTTLLTTPARAEDLVSPLQGGHYYPSLMNLRDLATPKPGLFALWYNAVSWSDGFYDQNGKKVSNFNLHQINPKLPDVPVDTSQAYFFSVLTAVWALQPLILGARYFAIVSLPFVSSSGSLGTDGIGGGGILVPPEGQTLHYSATGISDMMFMPVALSWSFQHLDTTFTYALYAPTGRYDPGAIDNTGLGFWTNQFQLFNFFYPTKNRATAIQLGATYELNSSITGQDVRPGNRFTIQYGIDHYFTDRLLLGLQGGNNWQVSNDSGSGVYWDTSVHDSTNFWGVNAGYWPWKDRLMINARYVQNYAPVEHYLNHMIYLNFIFSTDLLTGRK